MTTLQRQTGIAMIAIPVVFMAAFTGLQMQFDYPNALRLPAAEILERFQAGGGGLLAIWYIFMAAALAFIPVAVLSGLWLQPKHQTAAAFAATANRVKIRDRPPSLQSPTFHLRKFQWTSTNRLRLSPPQNFKPPARARRPRLPSASCCVTCARPNW